MTEYINRLITIEFSDREETETGFLLDFSGDWLLLQSNPVDFIIDGYTIVKNKNIEAIYRDEEHDFKERAFALKGILPLQDHGIPLDDIKTILTHLNSNFGIFQFYKKSQNKIYPGRLVSITDHEVTIDWIDLRGNWSEERTFKSDKIRIIEFENDYLKTLKLIADSE